MEQCLKSGEREWPNPPQFIDTIAEAIKLQQLGTNTFKILCELAEKQVFEVVSTFKYATLTLLSHPEHRKSYMRIERDDTQGNILILPTYFTYLL